MGWRGVPLHSRVTLPADESRGFLLSDGRQTILATSRVGMRLPTQNREGVALLEGRFSHHIPEIERAILRLTVLA